MENIAPNGHLENYYCNLKTHTHTVFTDCVDMLGLLNSCAGTEFTVCIIAFVIFKLCIFTPR